MRQRYEQRCNVAQSQATPQYVSAGSLSTTPKQFQINHTTSNQVNINQATIGETAAHRGDIYRPNQSSPNHTGVSEIGPNTINALPSSFHSAQSHRLTSLTINIPNTERHFYFLLKRLFDLVVISFALVLLAPLMALLALLVYMSSAGPIIVSEKRVGTRRRYDDNDELYWERQSFDFYKFRTVSDSTARPQYFTRIGLLLRTTGLDELPQLWNVLKGDMSLVGPRPATPDELDHEYSLWHLNRLQTIPGMIGLWHVESEKAMLGSLGGYHANRVDRLNEMIEYDIEYIEKQSFSLDIKILLRNTFGMFAAR